MSGWSAARLVLASAVGVVAIAWLFDPEADDAWSALPVGLSFAVVLADRAKRAGRRLGLRDLAITLGSVALYVAVALGSVLVDPLVPDLRVAIPDLGIDLPLWVPLGVLIATLWLIASRAEPAWRWVHVAAAGIGSAALVGVTFMVVAPLAAVALGCVAVAAAIVTVRQGAPAG